MKVLVGVLGAMQLELAVTESSFERMRGLLGRSLQPGQGLLLRPCSMIHTWGMKYSIDVIFINRRGTILKICTNQSRRKFCACFGAYAVIELPAGNADERTLQIGMTVTSDLVLL